MSASAPSLSIIVAMDPNRLIGRRGDLPWRLPNDLRHFKRTTMGRTLLMGRKTWESLPGALPGRPNWVISRQAGFSAPGARVFGSLDEALSAHAGGELMVMGGAELFRQVLPQVTRLYLTRVLAPVPGEDASDVFFPDFEEEAFALVSAEDHPADERHAWPYRFEVRERV